MGAGGFVRRGDDQVSADRCDRVCDMSFGRMGGTSGWTISGNARPRELIGSAGD
jgi:hypothetical protein